MPDLGALLTSAAEYALLMRVPIMTGAILMSLPFLARRPSARALLLGLFDVTPPSMIAVTLAASSVAGIVANNARVIYLHSYDRGVGGLEQAPEPLGWIFWFLLTALSLPVIAFTIKFSNEQNPGDLWRRIFYAAATLATELAAQQLFVKAFEGMADHFGWSRYKWPPTLFNGYSPMKDHIAAAAGFSLALVFYGALGLYGYTRLGKKATVPALCSALMVLMLACSSLSAVSFFLDVWHVPVLLVLMAWGLVTAQSTYSDHYYALTPRAAQPALTPIETLRATKCEQRGRIVVVAANGGGIQAAAWTAYVLTELSKLAAHFAGSLRLISSVSGGSLGSACYTYRLAQGETARNAADAASLSSLDEAAWGLGWTDLISSIFPWGTKHFIGRGRALERAWCSNCGTAEHPQSFLDRPLSEWNAGVLKGDLPAVLMNATIAESGQRLLFGTTRFKEIENRRARMDATVLHGENWDVAAVTAARLSATFPYVTPASRSNLPGARPHIVDGGYYDNYGMSTLVEWLDEALAADTTGDQQAVRSVLVIQIHGAPVAKDSTVVRGSVRNRGWFYQILAPLLTLNAVRGAGQAAHNDLELQQLQEKWHQRGVPIHTVTLEFPGNDAPLSWHLTRKQKEAIGDRWEDCKDVQQGREQVLKFLNGSDTICCPCLTCQAHLQPVRDD